MKRQVLVGCLLVSALNINCVAMEINNGKLLSHKEWSKGNITGAFQEVVRDNSKYAILKSQKQAALSATTNDVYLTNDIQSITGVVGQEIKIQGEDRAYIVNSTDAPHTYKVTHTLGSCFLGTSRSCYYEYVASEDVVSLKPGGSMGFYRAPTAIKTYDISGQGYTSIETTIQVDDNQNVFHYERDGEITVMNVKR